MKKKYLFFILLCILCIYAIYVAYTMYNKPHKDIAQETVDYQMTVDALYQEFAIDEQAATAKYLDKVFVLDGILKQTGSDDVQMPVITIAGEKAIANCEMSSEAARFKVSDLGRNVSVKGLFIGYDDLLGELQLKKCTILSK